MSAETTTPEFSIYRTLAVPRESVWRGWTDQEALAAWLHPFGVRLESLKFDVHVGGDYHYTMVNEATGQAFPTGGTFYEIHEPERIVFSWGEPGAKVDDAAVIAITMLDAPKIAVADEEVGTELEFHLRGFEGHPGDKFVYDGWMEALDNFERYLLRTLTEP